MNNKIEKTNILQKKSLAILMCTYNGQDYLQKQLDSIVEQTYKNWKIYISDDGSTDNTIDILRKFQNVFGSSRVLIQKGPQKGFAINFLSLANQENIQADFYAYSDQDDIWHPDKLQKAVSCLSNFDENKPVLYCSRSKLIDENENFIGYSPLFKIKPKFNHALVQNIAGGNTMVFNHTARNLLCKYGVNTQVVAHDWWMYLLVSACGGEVIYDAEPYLFYRQHINNLIGSNLGWRSRFSRVSMLFHGRYKSWNTRNINSLEKYIDLLTTENRKTIKTFSKARNKRLLPRLFGFFCSHVYRHNKLGQLALILAVVFNKI